MTTWIDLTDVLAWRGPHTGIQRVNYQLARQFAAHEADTRFFVHGYTGAHDFTEIPLAEVVPPARSASVGEPIAPARPGLRQLGRRGFALYKKLPPGARRRIGPRLTRLHRRIRNLRQRHAAAGFAPGDTVLVLGAAWVHPDLMPDLLAARGRIGFRLVCFVHDLIPITAPHLFAPGHPELAIAFATAVATGADLVVVNSAATGADLRAFCKRRGLRLPPTGVVRLADTLESAADPVPPADPPEPGFLLAVGTVEVRKNYALLYAVYQLAAERGVVLPQLVVVGRPGWHADDLIYALRHDAAVNRSIVLREHTDDHELAWLYRNCRFTLYPSLSEGWGMPVAESLVAGKLCLTTAASSLPEIAGDLIEYFSPFDAADCLAAVTAHLDPARLAAREAAIQQHYRATTWPDTYRQLTQILARP